MSKRIGIFLLCLAMGMTLGACSKPFGGTPYESVSGWEVDINDIPDVTESDEVSADDTSNDATTGGTGAPSTTANKGSNVTQKPGTTTTYKTLTPSKRPVDGSVTNASGNGQSDEKPTTTTEKVNYTTNTTVAVVEGVQLPAVGYSQDGMLVLNSIKLQGRTVTVEFKNLTKNFVTDEEKSKIGYVCYDKFNQKLSTGSINLGEIQQEKTVVRTFELAADTARVEFVNWNVPFWTWEFY